MVFIYEALGCSGARLEEEDYYRDAAWDWESDWVSGPHSVYNA